MALDIPLPGSFGKAFREGSDVGSNMLYRMMQNKIAKQQADTQSSLAPSEIAKNQAAAAKSQMLMDLINGGGMGGGGGGSEGVGGVGGASGANPNGSRKMTVNQAILASGLAGIPVQNVDGKTYTAFGTFDTGESPAQKSMREAKQQAAGDVLKKTGEAAVENQPLHNSYIQLKKLLQNPKYQKLAGSMESWSQGLQPFGLPIGAAFQKAHPEDARLISAGNALMGTITTAISAKFKGPFKEMVNSIIKNMKPNPGDSAAVQESKLDQLMALANVNDQQMQRFEELVGGGEDPSKAMNMAMNENQTANPAAPNAPAATPATPTAPVPKNVQDALNMFPPQLKSQAEDAISRGANPQAVLKEAAKLLNVKLAQ